MEPLLHSAAFSLALFSGVEPDLKVCKEPRKQLQKNQPQWMKQFHRNLFQRKELQRNLPKRKQQPLRNLPQRRNLLQRNQPHRKQQPVRILSQRKQPQRNANGRYWPTFA